MSERYRPQRLKREWINRLARGEKPRDMRQAAIDDQAAFERRRPILALRDTPRADLHCNHGVCWLDCLVCSKPRTRP